MKRLIFLFLGLASVNNLMGQGSVTDSSISMTLVMPGIALQTPSGDLADRFGTNSSISMDVMYKTKKGWMAGVQGTFLFGNKVKQPDLFSNLVTSQGEIIGNDGKYSDIRVFERGYSIIISAGRLFQFKKPNPNCGIFVTAGAGYLQHKIRIEDKLNVTPALQGDYVKGYDHLSSGLCMRQSIGYIYIGKRRLVNFFFNAEIMEGLTKGRRSFDFDLEKPDTGKRIDILTGLRIGWVLPIYKAAPDKFYFN